MTNLKGMKNRPMILIGGWLASNGWDKPSFPSDSFDNLSFSSRFSSVNNSHCGVLTKLYNTCDLLLTGDSLLFLTPDTSSSSPVTPGTTSPSFLTPDTSSPSFFPSDTSSPSFLPPYTSSPSFLPPDTSSPSFLPPDTSRPSFLTPDTSRPSFLSPDTSSPSFLTPDTSRPSFLSPDTSSPSFLSPDTSRPFFLSLDTRTNSRYHTKTIQQYKLDSTWINSVSHWLPNNTTHRKPSNSLLFR